MIISTSRAIWFRTTRSYAALSTWRTVPGCRCASTWPASTLSRRTASSLRNCCKKRTSCLPTNSRRRLSRVARMRSTMWKHWLNSATLRWLKLARRAFLCAVATNRFTVRHARCLWWSTPQQRATISRQAFYLPFLGLRMMECARLGSLLSGHIIEVVGTALPPETWTKIKQTLS